MNILILGGNRFVGKKVANALSLNHNVTIFNRTGISDKNITVIKGDRNVYNDHFNGYDIILDFCLFKPDQAEKLLNLIPGNQKYMFISSASVYNNTNIIRYTEDMLADGNTLFGNYAEEKALCEKIITKSNLDYIILRPTYIVGPDSHRPRLSYYFNKIETGQPIDINGNGTNIVDLVWVDDMVNTIVYLIDNWTSHQIYNIAGSKYTILELIELISTFLHKTPIKNINANSDECPFSDHQLTADNTKLNIQFKPLIDRMEDFYIWYLREGKKKYAYE